MLPINVDVRTLSIRFGGISQYTSDLWRSYIELRQDIEVHLYSHDNVLPGYEVKDLRKLRFPQRWGGEWVWEQVLFPKVVCNKQAIPVGTDFYLSNHHCRPGLVFIYDMMFLQSPDQGYRNRMERRVRDSVDAGHHVVTISQFCRKEISEYLSLSEDRISVVYPGVHLGRLEPAEKIERDRPMVLFLGEQSHRKNICAMLSAVKQLHSLDVDFDFYLVGKRTADENEILKHLDTLGLSDDRRIHRLGWVTDLEKERLWEQADVFLFPSKNEGFGMPVIESMARGVPVVTSNGGALSEVVNDAAMVVPLSSEQFIDDLAEKISMLLHSIELQEELKKKGEKRASLFSWQESARQLDRVLEKVSG